MSTEVINNNDRTFTQLYQDHHSWLIKWLEKRVQDRLQAEDHAHDTFLRIFTSKDTPN